MPSAPFLTVVMRTQGNRTATLHEALSCLSAQSSQDFEVCIVGHDLDDERERAVQRVVDELDDDMRVRVRLVRVVGGSRARPLNAGFADARGSYIAAFDDDDLVRGHWVETFEQLAVRAPGQVLRQVSVGQEWRLVSSAESGTTSQPTGGMKPLYAEHFDLLDHLVENRTPLHSVAFPRALFHQFHEHFDETLTTFEDWDYLLRAALRVGVAASPIVGCIYRHWHNLETSVGAHDDAEWRANYFRVLRKLDQAPLLLPAGSVLRLRDMAVALERLELAEKANAERASDAAVQHIEQLRTQCHDMLASRAWRWACAASAFERRLRGKRKRETQSRVWRMTAEELEHQIAVVQRTTFWRVAEGLRRLSGRSTRRPA